MNVPDEKSARRNYHNNATGMVAYSLILAGDFMDNSMSGNSVAKPVNKDGFRYEFKKNKALFAMITPATIFVFIMLYVPMAGLVLAFKSYRYDMGIFKSPWNGLGKKPLEWPWQFQISLQLGNGLADHAEYDSLQSAESCHVSADRGHYRHIHFRNTPQAFQEGLADADSSSLLYFMGCRRSLCFRAVQL